MMKNRRELSRATLIAILITALIVLSVTLLVLYVSIDDSQRKKEFCISQGYFSVVDTTSVGQHPGRVFIECGGSARETERFHVETESICVIKNKWGDCKKSKVIYKSFTER